MKKTLIAFCVLLFGILMGLAWRSPIFNPPPGPVPPVPVLPSDEKPLLAVVVENAPEARPLYGLSQAEFALETVTEGGITRILGFFQDLPASSIGPVRSARPYFVDWALGFGAVFAHSGGSNDALEKITSLGSQFFDVNEFSNERTFWRDKGRNSPHNLFTSTSLLQALAEKMRWKAPGNLGWLAEGEGGTLPIGGSPVRNITVDFSFDVFEASYEYDEQANEYKRFIAGKADIDFLNKRQITAKNIVVLHTTSKVIDEKLLTIDLATLGSGRAEIFRSGTVQIARWQKASDSSPLRLIEADGSLVTLNEGPTWFAVIDQQGRVTWK